MDKKILEEIMRIISYNPDSGMFTYLADTRRKIAGSEAGYKWSANKKGCQYKKYYHKGREYSLHRLAFLFMGFSEPDTVDHINGDGKDNRWCNLRAASKSGNARNSTYRKRPCSGYFGVYPTRSGKYEAKAKVKGETYYIGTFDSASEASEARKRFDMETGATRRHGELKNAES